MAIAIETKERNQSVELCRMIAAIAIVFLHIPLPDPVGSWIDCLSRFAVPFFFMVSGYYSFGRDSSWVKRRLINVLKLNIYASLPYYIWDYAMSWRDAGILSFVRRGILKKGIFIEWFLRHVSLVSGHLWYLAALVPCYLGLWLYVRFREGETQNNKPLYLTGFFLMWVYFALGTILPVNEVIIPYEAYRNGWFLGIPLFLLGMFLHEYEKTIVEKFQLNTKRLILLIAAGVLLSLLQWRCYGVTELYLGNLPEMIGLMLLLTANPILPRSLGFLRGAASRFGRISTVIYIIHILVKDMYDAYLLPRAAESLGVLEPWMKPFLVAIISFAGAILWDWLLRSIKIRRPVKA